MFLALCIFAIAALFFVSARYLVRTWFPRQEFWDGPKVDPDLQSRIIGEILIKYPDSSYLREAFKDEAVTADAVHKYLELERQNLSEAEYQKRLDEIIKNINIDDIMR
jgi:hypothetical protein